MPFCKFFFQKPQHIYIVEDNPENASAKAKIHTKPSFLSFLGDKCLIFWGKEGERTVRDQEEKEEGGNRTAAEPCSLRAGANWKTLTKVQTESWEPTGGAEVPARLDIP